MTHKIEPLNIEDFMAQMLHGGNIIYGEIDTENAIRALFEKQKEIIEVINLLTRNSLYNSSCT